MIIFGRKIQNEPELRASESRRERKILKKSGRIGQESDSENGSEKCHFRCAYNVDQRVCVCAHKK